MQSILSGTFTFFFTDIAHYLYQGDTALHMAAAAFRRPVAECLVAHGADVNVEDGYGMTPLMIALEANNKNLLRLLRKAGATR